MQMLRKYFSVGSSAMHRHIAYFTCSETHTYFVSFNFSIISSNLILTAWHFVVGGRGLCFVRLCCLFGFFYFNAEIYRFFFS